MNYRAFGLSGEMPGKTMINSANGVPKKIGAPFFHIICTVGKRSKIAPDKRKSMFEVLLRDCGKDAM